MSRGGYRWGRPHVSVENCHSLSAWGRVVWAQTGYDDLRVKWWQEDGYLILDYKRDGEKFKERIYLIETPCHFGGSRRWLGCPGCGRRVGKVYLPTNLYSGGVRVQRWRCRHCHKLTYEQRRSRNLYWALEYRVDRIAQRLISRRNRFYKPKGMRWKTFEQLVAKHNALAERSAEAFFLGNVGRLLLKNF